MSLLKSAPNQIINEFEFNVEIDKLNWNETDRTFYDQQNCIRQHQEKIIDNYQKN